MHEAGAVPTRVLRFVTMHAFDRRTDRILIARLCLHSVQRGKNGPTCRALNNNAEALIISATII